MTNNDYVERLLKEVHAKFGDEPLPSDLLIRFPSIQGPGGKNLTYDVLIQYPSLQESLAFIVHYTPSKWLLEQEAPAIRKLRLLHHPEQAIAEFQPQQAIPGPSQDGPGDIYRWARANQVSGICFSGGGIRSATFNLGVLQGLAKHGWLNRFDYLSSVSGGGYIHSWLAAWLKRKTLEQTGEHQDANLYNQDLRDAWAQVAYRLTPLPGRTTGEKYQTVWPRQIQWLRRYSNYLTPKVGMFTSDTWSAVAIWIRNVLLNQALLIAIFLCILSVPHMLAPSVRLAVQSPVHCPGNPETVAAPTPVPGKAVELFRCVFEQYWHGNWSLAGMLHFLEKAEGIRGEIVGALACFLAGTLLIVFLLRREYDFALQPSKAARPINKYIRWFRRLRRYQVFTANLMLSLLLVFGILLTRVTLKRGESAVYPAGLFLLLLLLVWAETFSGGALGEIMTVRTQRLQRRNKNPQHHAGLAFVGWSCWLLVLGVPAALAGAAVGVAIAALLQSWMMQRAAAWLGSNSPYSLQIVLGTLLFFWLAPLTMIIASGLIGKDFPDWLGEWLGRIRGYSLLIGIGWIFLCGSSLLVPGVLLHPYHWTWIQWPALLAWAATTAAGVLGGKSSETSGGTQSNSVSSGSKILELVVLIGPYVYIAGLVFLLSLMLEEVHAPLADRFFPGCDLFFWVAAIGLFLFLAALLGYRLDINEFSMHSFYRDRLTRCYLGASNLTRSPSPVTGFDQRDTADLQIAQLTQETKYPGPIPIFCCAMNITLGEDLAWQQRKAASFAFTPFYSGYTVGWTGDNNRIRFNGFVPTRFLYEGDPNQTKDMGGPNIATAMAASGAAVSPNWGYHTNPATAFLMTMFDVRLGLWIPNPRRSELAGQRLNVEPEGLSYPASPKFAPWWLTSELLGSVDDTSKYVYLTDGGHFDNMGLYELVRRRCYKIVICDAEEDAGYIYEGIGDAIRKCRIDFGAEIDLDLSALSPNTHSRLSPAHIIRGSIRYPETPDGTGEVMGEVLYIKASLTGKAPGDPPAVPVKGSVELPGVPGDVQNYKLQHEHFPHDSTAEQWFTESQFESYRRLGQSIVDGLPELFPGDAG
jgi:Patatin-like phospholipase